MKIAPMAAATWLLPQIALSQTAQDEKLAQVNKILENEGVQKSLASGFSAVQIVVPLAFFIFIFALVFVVFYWRYRQAKEVQTSIRLMVEKGLEVPIEMIAPSERSSYQADMRRGLILTLLGIALPIALVVSQPGETSWVWGLIPLALGVAYIISARISRS